jgi:hypothetical protein
MANELFVTLHSSDNAYLKYPCRGWLELFELGANGGVIIGVFRQIMTDTETTPLKMAKNHCPVEVKDPKFTYDPTDTVFRIN